MKKSNVTTKAQTKLPRDVRAALKIDAGDILRNVVPADEVQILKARSVEELSGMLRRPSQASASVEATDGAIAEIARDGINSCSSMRPAFICREVLVKLVWVVERFHKHSQNKITAAVMGLVSAAALQVETVQDVAEISPCTRKTVFDF